MKRTFIIAGAIGIATSTMACTAPYDATERVSEVEQTVVNGRLAVADEVLATVAVMYHGEQGCTGTLISEQIVVTAAHCLRSDPNADQSPDLPAEMITVVAGELDVRGVATEKAVGVERVISHAGYPAFVSETPEGLGRDDDFGVLVLTRAIANIEPVPILPPELVDVALTPGKLLTVSGYGITTLDWDAESGVLYTGETPFLKRTEHELLAGGNGHADACYGDSGGPLYVEHDGSLYLAGATSRGPLTASAECGESGIYTLAPADADWIEEQVGAPVTPPESDPDPQTPPDDELDPGDPVDPGSSDDADTPSDTTVTAGGCAMSPTAPGDASALFALLALALALPRRSRRRRQ